MAHTIHTRYEISHRLAVTYVRTAEHEALSRRVPGCRPRARQRDDLVPGTQQLPDNPTPDEPERSRHEHPHPDNPSSSRCRHANSPLLDIYTHTTSNRNRADRRILETFASDSPPPDDGDAPDNDAAGALVPA
jgi:hypothetical protein